MSARKTTDRTECGLNKTNENISVKCVSKINRTVKRRRRAVKTQKNIYSSIQSI